MEVKNAEKILSPQDISKTTPADGVEKVKDSTQAVGCKDAQKGGLPSVTPSTVPCPTCGFTGTQVLGRRPFGYREQQFRDLRTPHKQYRSRRSILYEGRSQGYGQKPYNQFRGYK